MKTKKNISVGAALLSLLLLIPSVSLSAAPHSEAQGKTLTFHNPSSFQRDEVVEVKGSELYKALGVNSRQGQARQRGDITVGSRWKPAC